MGPTICHGLSLRSVYKHVLPGLGHPEVTTLHSEAGATVDYIFYTPKCHPPSPWDDQKGVLNFASVNTIQLYLDICSRSLPQWHIMWLLLGLLQGLGQVVV